jgi:hypothetical protein
MLAERIPGAKLTEYKDCSNDFISQARYHFIKDPLDVLALKRD